MESMRLEEILKRCEAGEKIFDDSILDVWKAFLDLRFEDLLIVEKREKKDNYFPFDSSVAEWMLYDWSVGKGSPDSMADYLKILEDLRCLGYPLSRRRV